MTFIKGTPRSDVLLFPEALDDYVSDDNPVRFIEAFVDNLDLQHLGFCRTTPSHIGRPAYSPADLLKLQMSERVRANPEKMKKRKELVEHPCGRMKRGMQSGYFLMRGIKKVAAEMSLTVMAYNIKRVINILGVKKIIEAVV